MASEEFVQLLRRAFDGDLTEPLLKYVERNDLAEGERRQLANWIRHVLGRSSGPPWPPTISYAEHNAACVADLLLSTWRREHGRQRAPTEVRDKAIRDAIQAIARDLGIMTDRLSIPNVQRQMKSGRVKMRSARD